MKICVHLHVFYMEMLDELLRYVSNFSTNENWEYDLYVTMCGEHPESEQKIYGFKDNAHIIKVANRGYDVAPFLQVIKNINLDDYDYIVKLHSKRDLTQPAYLPNCKFKGSEWRDKLLEFIATPENLALSLQQFEENTNVGMVCAPELIITAAKDDVRAEEKAEKIMRGMGLTIKNRHFVAGTMFMARAKLFKHWQNLPYNAADFEEFDPKHKGGSLAHALERVLGYMIGAQGYRIAPYYPCGFGVKLKFIAYRIGNFLYYRRVNSKGKLHIKICKIPVYSKQLKI